MRKAPKSKDGAGLMCLRGSSKSRHLGLRSGHRATRGSNEIVYWSCCGDNRTITGQPFSYSLNPISNKTQALESGTYQDRVYDHGIDAGGDLRVDMLSVVIHRAIADADQSTLFNYSHQARTDDEWFASGNDSQQVPPRGKSDSFLKRRPSDITHVGRARLCEEQARYRGLFESQ